ncbi:IQ and ubiquitin-like domain-containing protein isoform X1, partial [Clarias magur]
MEKGENPGEAATGRVPETQNAGDEDNRDQTPAQQSRGSICIDQNMERSSPSQRLGQNSVGADDVGNSTATVKILLMPEGHMMTVAFMIGLTTQDLKNLFSNELRVPSDFIQITLNGNAVEDHQTLMSLGVQPHATVQFEMSSLDPENYPIKAVKPQQQCTMPDVITVRVQTDGGTYQDVVVEIERATQKKPFLGGYRHKVTKTEYHHAGVQTITRRWPDRDIETFSREMQTVQMKKQPQQCTITTSTQMTKPGCYISNKKDKLITPGRYVTADEYHSKRLNAVITIQAHTRRWLAKRLTSQLRLDKELRLAWIEREERRKKEEKEEQIRAEYNRRMNPQNRNDFVLLYNALESWRQEELEHINATLCGAERKAALCALLEQETQFIASIEHHRIAAGEKKQEKAVQVFLNKCAAPKRWQASDGTMTQMDTLHTIRARELRDLYCSLTLGYLSKEERLDVLLTLKHTVKEHDCKLTRDIVELIDREADLLMRSVRESNLEGLRKRIATLFLQYIKTPTFNPQVSKVLRVPQQSEHLKNVRFCRGCSKFLPSSEFSLTVNSRMLRLCRHCKELDNEARQRKDFSYYKTILKRLCKDESEINPDAKIPYLLQEQDIRYLVDVVWFAQSAFSAWNNLHDLLMVRWDKYCEWSPWNCILLTKEEAAAHLKVRNIHKIYGTMFICDIKHKHSLARKYFSKIPVMVEYLHDVDSKFVGHNHLLVTKLPTMKKKKYPNMVATMYFKDFHLLLLGVICLATSIEKWGLHRRIALRLVTIVGVNPGMLMLGFMVGCAFLSMWLSNTSTVAMVMPIAEAVMQQVTGAGDQVNRQQDKPLKGICNPALQLEGDAEKQCEKNTDEKSTETALKESVVTVPEEDNSTESLPSSPLHSNFMTHRDQMMCKSLSLGIAYAANIGGLATLPGTSSNLVFAEYIHQFYPECKSINFGNWFIFALPICIIVLFLAWILLHWMFLGPNFCSTLSFRRGRSEREIAAAKHIKDQYNALGSM